jgi:4-diphosphocytidyl-2-C-methyl-D-erythritol kinase
VDTALRALSKVGPACLTGTGGGCFAAFTRPEDAADALHRLPRGLRAWVAAGVQRSPLLDALEHAGTN